MSKNKTRSEDSINIAFPYQGITHLIMNLSNSISRLSADTDAQNTSLIDSHTRHFLSVPTFLVYPT